MIPRTLITGATSGIGAALAESLADEHELVLHGRDEAKLRALLTRCAHAERHRLWVADFTQPFVYDAGAVTHFVHCAGMSSVRPIRDVKPEDARSLFHVNFFSAAAIIAALDPGALRSVVFVSSVASLRGEKGAAIYAASKGAINAFVRSLAAELAPHVRVNAVLPGLVRTAMAAGTIESGAFEERILPKYPLGIGEPGDVVAVARELLSERTRQVTGAQWIADGGRAVI